jgi:hypothetical protein
LEATSRRFGRRTDKETAPNMKQDPKEYSNTTFRVSYKSPSVHDKPNFRSRDNLKEFDTADLLKVKLNSATLVTGYESNR